LGVVLDADPGQVGDLAAAQPGHATIAVEVPQAGLLGGDPGPAGAEEGFDLVTIVHAFQARPDRRTGWWAVSTPSSSIFSVPRDGSLDGVTVQNSGGFRT
jgi:hypothetical protein